MRNREITKRRALILALVFFTVLVIAANWSILFGFNRMKWDIIDAQYPIQSLVSDALRSGQLPLWMPLFRFGMPYYTVVGMPVWYPVTIILDLIGYGPSSPAVEYSVHMVLGAMGMFLLGSRYINSDMPLRKTLCADGPQKKESMLTFPQFVVLLAIGTCYGFSGVFLSNAQHIMITVSAAWVPFSIYYSEKYSRTGRLSDAFKAGICSGMILLGGYPEIFFDLFLTLIPCMVCWMWRPGGIKDRLAGVVRAAGRYICVAVTTVMFSAVSLLPFLHVMRQITRGEGQSPAALPFSSLLSLFIPVTSEQIGGREPSMEMFYMGVGMVVVLLLFAKIRKRHHLFYVIMAAAALLLSLGGTLPLHPLLYRFVPLYSTFRFPSLWRPFFAMFALIAAGNIWDAYFRTPEESGGEAVFAKDAMRRVFVCALAVSVTAGAAAFAFSRISTDAPAAHNAHEVCRALIPVAVTFALYFLVSFLRAKRAAAGAAVLIIFLAASVFDVLSVADRALPFTVAVYDSTTYFRDPAAAEFVDGYQQRYDARDTSTEFSGHRRSRNGIKTEYIVRQRLLDEDGYLSVQLKKTEFYKNTYNRSIIQQDPVLFFTDDIVDSSEMPLEEWRMRADVPQYQVHVESKVPGVSSSGLQRTQENVLEERELKISKDEDSFLIDETVGSSDRTSTKIRLYFDGDAGSGAALTLRFKEGGETSGEYSGVFAIETSGGSRFTDISFPVAGGIYSGVEISGEVLPSAASLVELENISQDDYAKCTLLDFRHIRAEVNAPDDGILAVLQTNYYGWTAYVDGQKTEITEINDCFIGVPVTGGEHVVELRFMPLDFILGLIVTLFTAVCAVVLSARDRRTDLRKCPTF